METRTWEVYYINYRGEMKRTEIEASVDAEEWEVIRMAYDAEGGGYSSDYIWKIAYVM